MELQTDLLIVGAGPAGLAHAFWRTLDNADLDYRVVDAAPEPGGWVQTRRVEGYLCEAGPQGIRPSEASDEFLAALGIEDSVVAADAAAKSRFLARDGTLHALPSGPGALLTSDIFSAAGKLSLCLEPFRSRGNDAEESLAAFAGRRFGRQTVPLAEAMASGVYGGDAHEIEMAAAFPAIARIERDHGSLLRGVLRRKKKAPRKVPRPVLATFGGGMALLVQRMREHVGDRLTLGREVIEIARQDDKWCVTLGGDVPTCVRALELVLAIPARRAAPLLASVDPDLARSLAHIPYASIANIYLGFREEDARRVMSGFGFLLDRREESPMLGAIYCSSIFPQSAPQGKFLVRVMAGGRLRPDAVDRDEEDLSTEAGEMLRSYTGLEGSMLFKRVYKVRDAIPQYVRGHTVLVRNIRDRCASHPGLQLIGNSYDEVSVVGQLRRPQNNTQRE